MYILSCWHFTECIEKEACQRIRLSIESVSSSDLNQTEKMMVKCVAVTLNTTRVAQPNIPRLKKWTWHNGNEIKVVSAVVRRYLYESLLNEAVVSSWTLHIDTPNARFNGNRVKLTHASPFILRKSTCPLCKWWWAEKSRCYAGTAA